MVESAEQDTDPWKPLLAVGRINFVLGIFSLARIASEIVQLCLIGVGRGDHPYLLVVALDVPTALLWFLSGRLLRRRSPALVLTVLAASIALADSLVSAWTLGPLMVRTLLTDHDPYVFGIFGARLLLYVVYLLYSPFALAVALRDHRRRGLLGIYEYANRAQLWILFLITTSLTLFIQGVVKYRLMN